MRTLRAACQAACVAFASLLAANAAYLIHTADQSRTPGAILTLLDRWGLFPFGADAGTLSIEDYCPLGPIEGVVRFVQTALFEPGLSFVGPVTLRNLGVFLALVGLALVTKKTFCSWLCPFGALFEGVGALGRKLGLERRLGVAHDRWFRRLRHVGLVLLVVLTAWSGTLLFKEIDPFFAIYSLGSEVRPWMAYASLALLLSAAVFLPGIWCHYLCPMSAALDPFSRLGRIRPTRTSACTRCGTCAAGCPQRIPLAVRDQVKDASCTNCLTCFDVCPERGALELRLHLR